jgi:M6 family metalloprotease-like protein
MGTLSRRALRIHAAALVLAAGALAAGAFLPARVADETRTGWLNVVWQTRGVRNELVGAHLFLVDEAGRGTEVAASAAQLAPYGGLTGVNGRRMTVTGDLLPAGGGRSAPLLRLRSLSAVRGPRYAVTAAEKSGPQAYVLLLCRFADRPSSDPQSKATYAQWLGSSYPGIDQFWRENSENRVSINTTVVGPFVLPLPADGYLNGNGAANVNLLFQDCTHAADPTVDFTQYAGIHMQFNAGLGGFSYGGGWTTTFDGQTRYWAMTWMADWAAPSTWAHETGHSLGLPHSSGPYGETYDSRWDVMSGGGTKDPALGTWVAPHTIAFHKDLLGWIPAARKYVAAPGSSATFELARDAIPGAEGYQMAQIPISGSSVFYTVEARRYAGYDAIGRLPSEAVLIHRVNLADGVRAKVVDPDGNLDPNDAGAAWTPGETFTDVQGGVQVRVLSATATGFRVEVSTGGTLPLALDSVLAPATMGADYGAALAPGLTGASWTLVGGALPKGVALSADGKVSGVPAESGSFRFTVSVVQPGGFATRELRLEVARPQLAEGAVLDHLLGGATLTADQARFIDLQGNANGHLDVGDVRAWMIAQGLLP